MSVFLIVVGLVLLACAVGFTAWCFHMIHKAPLEMPEFPIRARSGGGFTNGGAA